MNGLLTLATIALAMGQLPQESAPPARFAIIVGVNKSVDADVATLRFADDDAFQYDRLFRALGFETVLLVAPDEATQRLYPEESTRAQPPTERGVLRAVELVSRRVQAASKAGRRTNLTFVYAGHGNVDEDGVGYVSLSGARLTGPRLGREVLSAIRGVSERHLIVDACASFFLAHERGPGGEREPIRGFSRLQMLPDFEKVGLVLSTSSGNESHEWEGFGAGVFSHEVRSALYGAADADLDGRVAYKELAAFVERANSLIPNERYRPTVYVRAAAEQPVMVEVKRLGSRRVEVGSAQSGHYFVEDRQGVRVLEFNSSSVQALRFILPEEGAPFWLRRVRLLHDPRSVSPYEIEAEYALPDAHIIRLSEQVPASPSATPRGAAHQSFGLVFRAPFDRGVVDSFRWSTIQTDAPHSALETRIPWIWTLAALSASAMAVSVGLAVSAEDTRSQITPSTSQLEVAALDSQAGMKDSVALVAGAAGAALLAGSLAVWLWPDAQHPLTRGASQSGPLAFGLSF